MMIFSSGIEDLLEWFDSNQNPDSDVLCLIISDKLDIRSQIQEIIDESPRIDSIIGENISLVIFDNKLIRPRVYHDKAIGAEFIFGGNTLKCPPILMQEVLDLAGNTSPNWEVLHKSVYRSMMHMNEQIRSYCDIQRSETPCLVVFFKGVAESVKITIKHCSSGHEIIEVLHRICQIYEQTMSDWDKQLSSEILFQNHIQEKIDLLSGYHDELQELKSDTENQLFVLQKKYDFPDDKIKNLILSVRANRIPGNIAADIVSACPNILKTGGEIDPRVIRLQKNVSKISSTLSDIVKVSSDREFNDALSSVDDHILRMEEVYLRLQEFDTQLHRAAATRLKAAAVGRSARSADAVAGTGNKVFKLISGLRTILGLS